MRALLNTTKGKVLGFFATLAAIVAVSSPASAAVSGPDTVGEWGSASVSFAGQHIPEIGLALVAVAGATIVLAIGTNLLSRVYANLSSLGGRKPVKGR